MTEENKAPEAKLGFFDKIRGGWGRANTEKLRLIEDEIGVLNKQLKSTSKEAVYYRDRYTNTISRLRENKVNQWKERHILTSTFNLTAREKWDVYNKVKATRDTYLYAGIVSLLVEDSLAPSIVTNDIVAITSTNKKFQDDLDEFQKEFDLDEIVKTIVGDLLSFGEYFLSTEVDGIKADGSPGKGITAILDNVEQGKIVALYDGVMPSRYIVMNEKGKQIGTKKPYEIAHFIVGDRKLRIKVEEKQQSEYVRIGRPLFWGTFELLQNLMLMTALIPASYVQKINNSSIIGVQVAEGTSPDDAFSIADQFQSLLNKTVTFDHTSGEISISDVLNMAGKFKVIPQYGDKGSMSKVDPRFDEITDLSVLDDLRQSIMSAIGVPYNFLFGGSDSKGDTLKTFSRYVRKLHNIQAAVGYGLKQLAMTHLLNRGHKPSEKEIDIKFTNALVHVEDLDKIEFIDTLVSTLGNVSETVNKISQELDAEIDRDELAKFFSRFLKPIGLDTLFILNKEEEPKKPVEPEDDEEDEDDDDDISPEDEIDDEEEEDEEDGA